jgi:hypothetical protein
MPIFGGVEDLDPDPGFLENPDPDPAFLENPDPDLAFLENPVPDPCFLENSDPDPGCLKNIDPDQGFLEIRIQIQASWRIRIRMKSHIMAEMKFREENPNKFWSNNASSSSPLARAPSSNRFISKFFFFGVFFPGLHRSPFGSNQNRILFHNI